MKHDRGYYKGIILGAIEPGSLAVMGMVVEPYVSVLVSNLAFEFHNLKSQKDRLAVIGALNDLVLYPDATLTKSDGKNYWRALYYLAKYFSGSEKESLKSAYYEKLFNREIRGKGLSAYILQGFIAVNGCLSRNELERLVEIKEGFPIVWLDAAVKSGFFELARDNAVELIKEGNIDEDTFLAGMDAWHEIWMPWEDFAEVIMQFHDAAYSDEEKDKFILWLKRRGIPIPKKHK